MVPAGLFGVTIVDPVMFTIGVWMMLVGGIVAIHAFRTYSVLQRNRRVALASIALFLTGSMFFLAYASGQWEAESTMPALTNAIDLTGIVIVNLIGVVFSLFWIWTNMYVYYPLAATTLRKGTRWLTSGSGQYQQDRARDEVTDGGVDTADQRPTPTFDVLLPAYEESSVIENSIASVRNAEYDQSRITLTILTEPDDEETRATLTTLESNYEFTELVVPEDYPGDQNKPRALNYAFDRTEADLVCVIDAENIFSPSIFQAAATELAAEDVDYVQARLDMVNEDDGWLNTLFRAEYGYWYQAVFPPFFDVDYPIPLGGTSCVFERSVLDIASRRRQERNGTPWDEQGRTWVSDHGLAGMTPWDPENVTEDFELGLFLWQEDFTSSFLPNPVTDEESPVELQSWMSQRTRWQKGKLYTFLEHLRQPRDSVSENIHLYSQSVIPHLGPINIGAFFLILLIANLFDYSPHPVIKGIMLFTMVWGVVTIGLFGAGYWRTSDRSALIRLRRTVVVMLTVPLYWVLHWIADIRAFVEAYRGDFSWAKTAHGGRNAILGATAQAKSVSQLNSEASDRFTLARKHRLAALVAIVVLATILRLYGIGGWSLFGDELYTIATRADEPVAELLFTFKDTHPPLHFLILHYWMKLFGNSPSTTRLLSAIFSIGTVIAVYYLGAELYDDQAGLFAALITALSVYQVHYSQVTRMYSMLAFFTAISWLGFARLNSNDNSTSVYLIGTVLLIYTHLYAIFVVAAQNLYTLFSEDRPSNSWQHWLILQTIIGIFSIPWIWFLLKSVVFSSAKDPTSLVQWLPEPGLYTIIEILLRYIGYALNYPLIDGVGISRIVAAWLVFLYTILAFLAIVRYRSNKEFELVELSSGAQLFLLLSVPVIFPLVISYLLFPMLHYRYVMPASIGMYVLVGRGISNIDRRWLTAVVTLLVITSSAAMLADHYTNETAEDLDVSINCLKAETDPGDMLIVQPPYDTYFDYYSGKLGVKRKYISSPMTQRDIRLLRQTAKQRDTVWIFRYSPGQEIQSEQALSILRKTHTQVVLMKTVSIGIYRFEQQASTEQINKNSTPSSQTPTANQCPAITEENSADSVSSDTNIIWRRLFQSG